MAFIPKKHEQPQQKPVDFSLDDYASFQPVSAVSVVTVGAKAKPKSDLEQSPRATLIRMLEAAPEFDKEFSFKVERGTAHKYVHRMRVEMSRARAGNDDLKKGKNHFRLFVVGVELKDDHDLVTIVRSQRASLKQLKASDELAIAMRAIGPEKGVESGNLDGKSTGSAAEHAVNPTKTDDKNVKG